MPYGGAAEPDVIMRSIWVHSNYMQALDSQLLVSALELQDALLGVTENFNPRRHLAENATNTNNIVDATVPLSQRNRDAIHVSNGLTNQSWFFHSPLLYWSCSRDRILADPDIVATVNDRKNQSTSVNVTLRHSIVFSGKHFEDRRLLAADALVITLLHLEGSPVGKHWEAMAAQLPDKVGAKWDIYPADGSSSGSSLYEFQFRPLSMQDMAIFLFSSVSAIVYVFTNLKRNRAVHSKIGLSFALAVQVTFSLISSFTVCGIIDIDLSRVPQTWYLLVICGMSQENMFRFINAVLLTTSGGPTSNRIGEAYGETAHIALLGTLQNVAILLGLSRLVTPAVSAFCLFVAVAIVFDFFYLSTFLLSILCVDVERTDLSDAIAKAAARRQRRMPSASRYRRNWLEQVFRGEIALSTRIVGTLIMVYSILLAQWHFFDEDLFKVLFRTIRGSELTVQEDVSKTTLLENIHQARSPTSWLRLQDHETALEVINIIKPAAHSYIAKVYEPVVFVLKGSNRTPSIKAPKFLPAVYDFAHHELAHLLLVLVFSLGVVRTIVGFALWKDEDDDLANEPESADGSLLSLSSYPGGHTLDIALLTTSCHGHVVTVGLDRSIRIWNVQVGGFSYSIPEEQIPVDSMFPILAMAIDDEEKCLALISPSVIRFWDMDNRNWCHSVAVNVGSQKPECVFFRSISLEEEELTLVVISCDGRAIEIQPASENSCTSLNICGGPLASAHTLIPKGMWESNPSRDSPNVSQALMVVLRITLSSFLLVRVKSQQFGVIQILGWTQNLLRSPQFWLEYSRLPHCHIRLSSLWRPHRGSLYSMWI